MTSAARFAPAHITSTIGNPKSSVDLLNAFLYPSIPLIIALENEHFLLFVDNFD